VLVFEALQAAWRYVALASRRGLVPYSTEPFVMRECETAGLETEPFVILL
jgi:hypothetical protein